MHYLIDFRLLPPAQQEVLQLLLVAPAGTASFAQVTQRSLYPDGELEQAFKALRAAKLIRVYLDPSWQYYVYTLAPEALEQLHHILPEGAAWPEPTGRLLGVVSS